MLFSSLSLLWLSSHFHQPFSPSSTFCARCASQLLANKSQLTANHCRQRLQIRHILTAAIIQQQHELQKPPWEGNWQRTVKSASDMFSLSEVFSHLFIPWKPHINLCWPLRIYQPLVIYEHMHSDYFYGINLIFARVLQNIITVLLNLL